MNDTSVSNTNRQEKSYGIENKIGSCTKRLLEALFTDYMEQIFT